MITDRLSRFIERNMLGLYIKDNGVYDLPDWLWDAIFELFTHE